MLEMAPWNIIMDKVIRECFSHVHGPAQTDNGSGIGGTIPESTEVRDEAR